MPVKRRTIKTIMVKLILLCAFFASTISLAYTQSCEYSLPRWPSEFRFVRGIPSHARFFDCVKITVPERATIWTDKYFCQQNIRLGGHTKLKLIGMRWSHNGKSSFFKACVRTTLHGCWNDVKMQISWFCFHSSVFA